MKKRIFVLFLVFVSCISVACGKTEPIEKAVDKSAETGTVSHYDQNDVIYIGGAYQLSGTKINMGDVVNDGVQLALSEINANGGVLGKRIELVRADIGATTQENVTAVTKLLERGDISAFIGSVSSTDNVAVSNVVKEYKIPMIACGSSANVFKENNEYIWQPRVTDNYTSTAMVEAYVNVLGLKKPALFYTANSYGQGLADNIKENLSLNGIKPTTEVTFVNGETNFAPLVTQVVNSGCDGIISIADATEGGLIMKQLYSMRINLPCLGGSVYSSAEAINNSGKEAAAGWYTVSDWSMDVDTTASRKFIESWSKMYPNKEPMQNNLYSYDGLYLLCEAINIAGSADPAAINDAMGKISGFVGAMSVYTPDENRSMATTQLLCVTNKEGKVEIAETIHLPR